MRNDRGFTQVELITALAVVALLATLSITSVGRISSNAKAQKLETEVMTLNSAVAAYRGSGGQIPDDASSTEIIMKLKSVANSELVDHIPGLSSSMVDARLSLEVQSEEEAETSQKRVVWDGVKNRFEIVSSGDAGIKAFALNADPELAKTQEDDRVHSFTYAKESSWVWDFEEVALPTSSGPTTVAVVDETTLTVPDVPTVEDPEDPDTPEPTLLAPPTFSIGEGSYSIRNFNLPVTISNPNPPEVSNIFYSVDFGPWEAYNGDALDLDPDSVLMSQAIAADDTDFLSSLLTRATYSATPATLLPPTIETSSSSFGALDTRFVGVGIYDNNTGDPSYVEYRVAGGPWQVYDGPFVLDREDYLSGVVIESRAISSDDYYHSSESASNVVTYEPIEIESAVEGDFSSGTGPSGFTSNSNADNHFAWGRTTDRWGNPYQGQSQSELLFNGSDPTSVGLGTRFQLGALDYHNGSFLSNTGADGVGFALDLDLMVGGQQLNEVFNFEFELLNILNVGNYNGNGSDAIASADTVRISDNSRVTQFTLGSTVLEFALEFGEATENGFSNFNEFFVFENRGASTNVYGTLTNITPEEEAPGGQELLEANGKGKGKGLTEEFGNGNNDSDPSIIDALLDLF